MSQLLPERRRSGAPERWEPLQEFDQVTERMRRMLDETFGGFGRWPSLLQEAAGWSPLVDIEEHDDAYVLEAELPGVKRDDVGMELVGNELAISGELTEKERTGSCAGGHAGPAASTTASRCPNKSMLKRSMRRSPTAS